MKLCYGVFLQMRLVQLLNAIDCSSSIDLVPKGYFFLKMKMLHALKTRVSKVNQDEGRSFALNRFARAKYMSVGITSFQLSGKRSGISALQSHLILLSEMPPWHHPLRQLLQGMNRLGNQPKRLLVNKLRKLIPGHWKTSTTEIHSCSAFFCTLHGMPTYVRG